MSSRLYKVRQWQNRLATMKRSMEEVHDGVMDEYGSEGTVTSGGDTVSDATDDVLAMMEKLERILEGCALFSNQKPRKEPSA